MQEPPRKASSHDIAPRQSESSCTAAGGEQDSTSARTFDAAQGIIFALENASRRFMFDSDRYATPVVVKGTSHSGGEDLLVTEIFTRQA